MNFCHLVPTLLYVVICKENTKKITSVFVWKEAGKNQLPSAKFESEAGSECSAGTGQFCTTFSSKAFMEHLINFIVADDQVIKPCLSHLLG